MLGFGAIAPYTYFINGVQLISTTAFNLAAGSYIVMAVDANGCSKTSVANIGASIRPNIAFTAAPPNCDSINGKLGLTVTNATGSITYNWFNGNSTTSVTG